MMKPGRNIGRALLIAALCSVAGTAFAQGPGYPQGQGGGQGYGPAYGPGGGPGMMGGYGGGPGYGPGAGMGPRGGPDYGPGSARGRGDRGMTPGIGERLHALGLTEEQRQKVGAIMEDTRRKNWDVIGQVQTERYKLRQMFHGDTVDPAAVTAQQAKVDDLKRQLLRARLEARNQVFALLTPEQREKARRFGPRGAPGSAR